MSSKHYIKHYKQQKWTLKNCYVNKLSKTTIAIRFKLLQVCPCVSPFVFLCYLYLVFVFWAVISMFHSIWCRSHSLDFDKFCDTAPLKFDSLHVCRIALWWIASRSYLSYFLPRKSDEQQRGKEKREEA